MIYANLNSSSRVTVAPYNRRVTAANLFIESNKFIIANAMLNKIIIHYHKLNCSILGRRF